MNPILLDIPTELETERLLLRAPRPGDGEVVNQAVRQSINELKEWLVFAQEIPKVEESESNQREAFAKFIKRECFRYLMFNKVTDAFIGTISYENVNWDVPKAEIGYWIHTEQSGKGYMTEAAEKLTDFGLDHIGFKRIEIRTDKENHNSRSVPERLGYELEAILKNDDISVDGGEPRDTCIYAKIKK
ncbi:N-acetyltransferase [Filobacillus milosensis]|uniref:N-acetyltransferase n=1 Tax=Filobacillus milosensis TaxID=94137 RepID=A0A4Y8INU6_9BACI|nr:GNAT family N-acetyltransferase [Filobacillus milosensis]TFB21833.1 N-acetyltransferase [Filobacillus milosensis]